MSRVRRLPAARRDLVDLYERLGRDSPSAAERFHDACEETFQRPAFAPGLGRSRGDLHPSLGHVRSCRVDGFENHLVVYTADPDGVTIVRVIDGRRDLPGIALEDL